MAIDATKKSARLLQSRRYTSEGLGDAQEAFTRVLDLSAAEIYSQQNYIPSASLPFSESGQNGYYFTTTGTGSATPSNQDVMRYWYRQQLTPGVGNNQVWFFLNAYTASGASSPSIQIIQPGQLTNFISPKYTIPSLAGNNAEVGGYKARLFVDGTEYTQDGNYAFDYKTGVLQWLNGSVAPSIGANVQLTAYQYVGKTLASDQISGYSGSFSGSFQGDGSNLTNVPAGSITGLNLSRIATGTVTGSITTGSDAFVLSSASVDLFKVSNTGVLSGSGANLRDIPAGAISGLNLSQIATGSVSASVNIAGNLFQVVSGSTIPLSISSSGQIRTSQSLVQPNITGAILDAVNIAPLMTNTTSSQTQVAFRIRPTFTGSFSGSNTTNIIADFGSTQVGTQLQVTDVTSGSIYMVNDYSGLPILEATSDTTFKLYSYPYTVLNKTGSDLRLGDSSYSGSTVTVKTDLVLDEGLGHTYRMSQVSSSTSVAAPSGSLFTVSTITFPRSVTFQALVTGYGTSSRDTITGELKSTFKWNTGGALSVVGNNIKFVNADNANSDVNFAISASSMVLTVTGSGTEIYKWHATITTQIV